VIDRKENRHAAFGLGIHRCVGSNLARMEMTVAIEEWLKRIPDFRLDPAGSGHLVGRHRARTATASGAVWKGGLKSANKLPSSLLEAGRDRSSPMRPVPDHLDLADVERRIKAIFTSARSAISSSGMISTPTRRSRFTSRRRVFSEQRTGGAAAQRGRAVRRHVPDAAARRLAVRFQSPTATAGGCR